MLELGSRAPIVIFKMARCRFGNLAAFQWKYAAGPAQRQFGVGAVFFADMLLSIRGINDGSVRGGGVTTVQVDGLGRTAGRILPIRSVEGH